MSLKPILGDSPETGRADSEDLLEGRAMRKLALAFGLVGFILSCGGGGGGGAGEDTTSGNGGSLPTYYVKANEFTVTPTTITDGMNNISISASLDYRTINGVVEIRLLGTDGTSTRTLVSTFYCGGVWSNVCDKTFTLTCKYQNDCFSCQDPTDTSGQGWTPCVNIPPGTYEIILEVKGWVRFDQDNPTDKVYRTITVTMQ